MFELILLRNYNLQLFSTTENPTQTRWEFRIDHIDVNSHAGQFPSWFRKAENEKNICDERVRETSRRIDEVAGAFGQDILKWPRRWHRLLESIQQNSSRR